MTRMHIISAVLYSPVTHLLAVIIILTTLLIRLNNRIKYDYWKRKNVTVAHYPSLREILVRKLRIELIEQELVRKYGNVFGTYHIGKQTLFCAEPELIGNILSKDFTIFPNRKNLVPQNSITQQMLTRVMDEKWKRIRTIVTPTFSIAKLRKMIPIIDECLQTLINDFNRLIVSENNELDVKILFGAFTMNVIASTAFGVKVDALTDKNNPLVVNARNFFDFNFNLVDKMKFFIQHRLPSLKKIFTTDLKVKECQYFADLTKKIIDERNANKNYNNETNRYDFLHLLLETLENEKITNDKALENDGISQEIGSHLKTMSFEEIAAQCVIFFAAGYESTSITLSYCAYNIACNPDIQQILYEEAKSVLENKDELDYELINSLKYTDAVVSETLRIFPPAISINREASADYVLGNTGIKVSKGDMIQIPIYAIHRSPENFSEPEMFKPERFFPENRSHHPYAYLPFGAGPRNCVARRLALIEAKLAILYSVSNFRFSLTDKTECPPKTIFGHLLSPEKILLRVEKR